MDIELIPYPISLFFLAALGFAGLAVLWKIRKRAKIYAILFKAGIIFAIVLLLAIFFSIL